MGTMEVPADALYGASTQRAVLNFPVSGYRFGREFIRALGLIKWAPRPKANLELGRIADERAALIARAARRSHRRASSTSTSRSTSSRPAAAPRRT